MIRAPSAFPHARHPQTNGAPMNEQQPSPFENAATEPFANVETNPFATPSPAPAAAAPEPVATFAGRTPRKTAAVRAGIIVGTGLLVVVGAAVAMGASPSPASSGTGNQPQAQPGGNGNGNGNGFGRSFGGPFGQFLPGGPNGKPFRDGGPGFKDGREFGKITVTAISGDSVSLATEDGWTRTITVTSTTKITKGGAAATLTDLKVGDVVRFGQTRNADGSFTITALEIVQPQVAGTVTAVGSDTITITLRDGTSQTLKTSASTTYHLEDGTGTRADVSVGATIVATGEKASDGSLDASSVWVRLPHVVGTVTSTTSSSVTIKRPDGTTLTIHVDANTTIRVAGVDSAKLSDLKTGMIVVAEGTQRSDGSIDARAIGAGQPGKLKGLGHDKQDDTPDASPAPNASGSSNG